MPSFNNKTSPGNYINIRHNLSQNITSHKTLLINVLNTNGGGYLCAFIYYFFGNSVHIAYFCNIIMKNKADTTISKRFALIGLAGYIAPRHLKAIQELDHNLVAAHDIFDSVGIIDRYFPQALFTTDKNTFLSYINGNIDYLSICTPNCFHCEHSIIGLNSGADVICEKPLALSVSEIQRMADSQQASGHKVWTILQLRHHPEIMQLKKSVDNSEKDIIYDVDLTYITPRGHWYSASWKSDFNKSGGVAANIGIHFIDMLHWIFGKLEKITIHHSSPDCITGFMTLKKARVRFFLSINSQHNPDTSNTMTPYRNITVNGKSIDFAKTFTDLHTVSYKHIIEGNGFSIHDAAPAIEALSAIRNSEVVGITGDYHPLAVKVAKH